LTDIVFLVLLFAHVGTVVLWMGASILYVSVLGPSITKLAPSSRADLVKAIGSAYEKYIVRNATIAIVAGLVLYAWITQVDTGVAPTGSWMPWILIGILSGLVAYIIGIAVVIRANRGLMRMMSQSSSGPTGSETPSTEMSALQRRVRMGSGLQALFLFIALLCMVVGANL
jgi:hypothetical protein